MPHSTPDSAPRALLTVRRVSVRLGVALVLDAVDLDVAAGEIVTLIGPNGAGKTTLLRVALGLIAPERGEARLAPGVRVGYMPQRLSIDATLPLSVRRFLSLAAPGPAARLAATLERVGASRTLEAPIQSLSGGELQRVLLARALLREPELLVLDEPSQGVDLAGQEELSTLIGAVRDERGCGVLMVSHDLHLVMRATDRVYCLDRSICCTGAPTAVTGDPEFQRRFPAPLPGFAWYTHHHQGGEACAAGTMRRG